MPKRSTASKRATAGRTTCSRPKSLIVVPVENYRHTEATSVLRPDLPAASSQR